MELYNLKTTFPELIEILSCIEFPHFEINQIPNSKILNKLTNSKRGEQSILYRPYNQQDCREQFILSKKSEHQIFSTGSFDPYKSFLTPYSWQVFNARRSTVNAWVQKSIFAWAANKNTKYDTLYYESLCFQNLTRNINQGQLIL